MINETKPARLKLDSRQWYYLAGIVITLSLFLYSLTDHADLIGNNLRTGEIYLKNKAYLEKTEAEASEQVIKLAALEGLFKTAQSSQVGISIIVDAQVTIGNELAALTRLVQETAEITLLSVISSLFLREAQDVAFFLTPMLYRITLAATILLLLYYLVPTYLTKFHDLIHDIFYLAVLVLAYASIVLPYSISATNHLAELTTKEFRAGAKEHINQLHHEYVLESDKDSLTERGKHATDSFQELAVKEEQKIEKLTSHYARYKVASLLDGVVFPLLLTIILFLLTQKTLLHVLKIMRHDGKFLPINGGTQK